MDDEEVLALLNDLNIATAMICSQTITLNRVRDAIREHMMSPALAARIQAAKEELSQ